MGYKPTCLVCQKEMVKGFMTEMGHGNAPLLPRWCEGEPELTALGEASIRQVKSGSRLTAYRCPECKALRLYAFDEE